MTPNELHDYLLSLKNKNALDPNIAEYKKTIREELRSYRSDQPCPPMNSILPYPEKKKDIVFYSFCFERIWDLQGGILKKGDS